MANSYLSTNMSLPVPVVGQDPGPDYAGNVNSSLTLIDAHDHSSGKGVQVTPAGLNINADLPVNGNNFTLTRSVRFQGQSAVFSAAADIGCLYEVLGELYYRDGSSNNVKITNNGNVAGAAGSIAGLVSPASANYVSAQSVFVWQSAASTPANMDAGSYIFRNITANSKGITLSAPSALATNYSLVLPAIPGVQSFMTLDASGNMAAPWTVDNSTTAISANHIIVKSGGITPTQLQTQLPATSSTAGLGGVAVSAGCGNYTGGSTTYVSVTNLSVTLTATGTRPVHVRLAPSNISPSALGGYLGNAGNNATNFQFVNTTTSVVLGVQGLNQLGALSVPVGSVADIDFAPAAGANTYVFQIRQNGGGGYAVLDARLIAYEG